MGFLQSFMQTPAAGSRGAQFGDAMSTMAPLLFSMAKGLRSGEGASAYAPQGLAAMMYQQQLADEKADKQRKEREAKASQAAAERMVAESLGMYGGGAGYDENAVRNSAMAANGGPTNAAARAMDLGPQIEETAAAIGMDPVDLATIISYETGGTFDPAKAGPTTQWGQHRGFIQFGEPQARQYGVDWNDPIGSQLGADGAVARYFKENGWQPGMGMLDAYSIVNAGAPGRYSAKDVQNGGAPGTVADKVNTQMAGHRRRAQAMFPQQQKQPRVSPERASQILANPNVPVAVKNMVAAQFMPQEQEKPQIVKGADGYNYWVAPGQPPQRVVPGIEAPEQGPEYGFNNGYFYDKNNPQSGAAQIPGMPPQSPLVQMDPAPPKGYRNVYEGGRLVRQEPIPGGPEDTSAEAAQRASSSATSSDVIVNAAKRASSAAEGRLLTGALGALAAFNPASKNAEVYRQVEVLQSTAKIEALNAMRRQSKTGAALGNVTDGEGKMLAASAGALDPASPTFERDLADYTRTLLRTIHGIDAGDAMFAEVWPTKGLRGVTNVADGPTAGYGRGGAMAANAASPTDIQGGDGQPISVEAMQILRDNPTPEYKAFFDEVFGPGSADRVLGQ